MKILFVINNFYVAGNGMSASARRTVAYLKEAGQEVRVLSGPNPEAGGHQPEFLLKELSLWPFNSIIRSSGFRYAKTDRAVIREAVAWADVVHLEEAFPLEISVRKEAARQGVPCTATYHIQPENIFSSLLLGRWKLPNRLLLKSWQHMVYDYCSDIQCPTPLVRDRLASEGFKARLHVISNGVVPDPCTRKWDAPAVEDAPFTILCIGRLAREKDQFTLLRAMRHVRHAGSVRLFFAGQGPSAKGMKRCAMKLYRDGILSRPPEFQFCDRDTLRSLAAGSQLLVHCANVEVEGLSVLEALQQGIVPVIAKGRLCATSQFALDERSIFPEGDEKALAQRIDYWMEHPEERDRTGRRYVEEAARYDIRESTRQLLEMFATAFAGK